MNNSGYTFFIATMLFSILLYGCGELNSKEQQQVNEAARDSLTSTTETWEVDMEIIEDGQKKIRLIGSYAATYNTEKLNETRIKGPVHIQVFDSTGAVKTRVESNRAIYRAEAAQFELFGNVDLRTRTKRHLQSEYLKWDQSKNIISTPRFVIITTPSDS